MNSLFNCNCNHPPFNYKNYISCFLGIDSGNGRFGEVSIHKCIYCKRYWLYYFYEIEAFSSSGRWYKILVDEVEIKNISTKNSIDYFYKSEWHYYGGSYFNTSGKLSTQKFII